MRRAALAFAALVLTAAPASALSLCPANHTAKRTTCLVDGDTGWQRGRKWRLLAIDAPEVSRSECAAEERIGAASRDRLLEMMRAGYRIQRSGRQDVYGRDLVTLRAKDGSDLGAALVAEGLAHPWPNRGNRWCGR